MYIIYKLFQYTVHINSVRSFYNFKLRFNLLIMTTSHKLEATVYAV